MFDSVLGFVLSLSPALILHITAGSAALIGGAVALYARKGARLHRAAGTVFFVTMLVMSAMGTWLAISVPSRVSVVAGLFAFYLVVTAWMAARRKKPRIDAYDYITFSAVLCIALMATIFASMASHAPDGLLDDFPAMVYAIFAAVAVMAASLDFKTILRGGVSGAQRIARHLWRMCAALYLATSSLFLGQQQIFPKALHGSPVMLAPVLLVLGLMVFWLIRVRFAASWRTKAKPAV